MKYIFSFVFLFVVIQTVKAQADSSDYYKAFLHLPAFSLNKAPDSSEFNNNNLIAGKPVVLLFFSPDCEHCQQEAAELLQNKELVKEIPVIMISLASMNEITTFINKFKLAELPNVTVTQDYNFKLGNIFKMKTFPAMYVYDEYQDILKAYIGNNLVRKMIDLFQKDR